MIALVVFACIGLAVGIPPSPTLKDIEDQIINYHENYGTKLASRIKAHEEAIDFDGSRITGGQHAALGQFPHMGGVIIQLEVGWLSVCGSSLLTNTKAITAAHCWYDSRQRAEYFVMVFGSIRLFAGGTRILTTNVQVHESWNPFLPNNQRLHNDLAIVNLPWIPYSSSIRNIALPSGALLQQDFVGWWAQAVGFGRTGDGKEHDISEWREGQHLSYVTLQVITNEECARYFDDVVTDATLCIDASAGRSTCGGDSGGPLQINHNGQDVMIAVTSFGYSWGCQWGWPAGFTRVTAFLPWIQARL